MEKKIILTLLAVLTLIVSISINTNIVQAADTVTVVIDSRSIEFPDASAYIDENGRTQLPARYVGETLGAQVVWDDESRKVTLSRYSEAFGETPSTSVYIEFYIDSRVYSTRIGRDGISEWYAMDTMAVIEQNRAYIPVRYIAEALGAKVDWNPQTKTVTITSKTLAVGDYIVPQSFTGDVFRVDPGDTDSGISLVVFTIRIGRGDRESVYNLDIDQFYKIISPNLGRETIEKIRQFMIDKKDIDRLQIDVLTGISEIFLDSVSGKYIRIVRSANDNFIIDIYDKDVTPPIL